MPAPSELQRVTIATDFSSGASDATMRAALLPLAPDAELTLLHVIWAGWAPREAKAAEEEAWASLEREVVELRAALALAGKLRVAVRTLPVFAESTHTEIIRRARANDADLIVIGRRGAGGVAGALLGSTAMRVLRKCDRPVLVVASAPLGPYARPVAAVDLDDESRVVIELAARLTPRDAPLTVVHAWEPPFAGFAQRGVPPNEIERYRAEIRSAAAHRMEHLVGSLHGFEGRHLSPRIERGEPRASVRRFAAAENADLVVVGSHGRSGVAHALLGSVAEYLVAHMPCDVLVARPTRFTFELP